MEREEARQALHCALSIGEELLRNGAEVGRVEDTIRRICIAYGAVRADVFSITSSIIATIFYGEEESYTETRRVAFKNNDMTRLDLLNRLSRKICQTGLTPREAEAEMEEIRCAPRYSFPVQMLTYAIISGSFTLFFGGDWVDMAASAVIGVAIKIFESTIKRGAFNTLISSLLCAGMGGVLANLAVLSGLGHHADLISIGNVMLLIPGLAFTNALRDLFSGDTVTGLIRFMESLLLSVAVAFGFTLANLLF